MSEKALLPAHPAEQAAFVCREKGIYAGSSLKSHNGASDGLRGGDEEGEILMNIASSSPSDP